MYSRSFKPPQKSSYFLFGPRGTGKSSWLKSRYGISQYIDLLDDEVFNDLHAQPKNLVNYIQNEKSPVIIDEIQKIPNLLNEVHRLIEMRKIQFILSGSSARKLRRSGVNLLAGRALTCNFYPFSALELGDDFDIKLALKNGLLPLAVTGEHPQKFLQSYIATYLREEVQQERLVRNMPAFHRFLQAASFSQGSSLNISNVARECGVERKVVEDYFSILEDLLIAVRIPVFTKKSKRTLVAKSKFYFFDAGVFHVLRPKGPLDSESDIDGAALETLVIQNIMAVNDHHELGYELFYWHTQAHQEVDFILYGKKRIFAIEVKRSSKIREADFQSLQLFLEDYPMAQGIIVYGGRESRIYKNIRLIPAQSFLKDILNHLKG